MTAPSREVLYDSGADWLAAQSVSSAEWRTGVMSPYWDAKLIEPFYAIRWIATGRFNSIGSVNPVRDAHSFLSEDWMHDGIREDGRLELATEMIASAVAEGRLRCAYVVPSPVQRREHEWSSFKDVRLEVITPSAFAGRNVVAEWCDGEFTLFVETESVDDEKSARSSELTSFLFLWDEVLRMTPGAAGVDQASGAIEAPSNVTAISTYAQSSKRQPQPPPSNAERRRRGRGTNQHGIPIATFIARISKMNPGELKMVEDKVLGGWLQEAYELARRMNQTESVPDLGSATKNALGARDAWIAANAQIDRPSLPDLRQQ